MFQTVVVFAIITALLEGLLIFKFCPLKWIHSRWLAVTCHIGIFVLNLVVHWGTIVGTMTAVTATLASFAMLPAITWLREFWEALGDDKLVNLRSRYNAVFD